MTALALAQGKNGRSGKGQRQQTDDRVSYVLAHSYSFHFHSFNYFVPISHQCRPGDGEENERVGRGRGRGNKWEKWGLAKTTNRCRGESPHLSLPFYFIFLKMLFQFVTNIDKMQMRRTITPSEAMKRGSEGYRR